MIMYFPERLRALFYTLILICILFWLSARAEWLECGGWGVGAGSLGAVPLFFAVRPMADGAGGRGVLRLR